MAAAQSQNYDFTFTSSQLTASGSITVNTMNNAITALSNFVVNGAAYSLDTSGVASQGPGMSPMLNSVTMPAYFANALDNRLVLAPTSGMGDSIEFAGSGSTDYVYDLTSGYNAAAVTESLTAAAPVPSAGAGLLSWVIAGFVLASLGVVNRLRKQQHSSASLI